MFKIIGIGFQVLGYLILWGFYTLFMLLIPVGIGISMYLTLTQSRTMSDAERGIVVDIFMSEHGWFVFALSALLAAYVLIGDVGKMRMKKEDGIQT